MISSFTRSDKFDYPTFRTGYLFPGHFISDGKDAQVNGLYVCVCLGVGSGGGGLIDFPVLWIGLSSY